MYSHCSQFKSKRLKLFFVIKIAFKLINEFKKDFLNTIFCILYELKQNGFQLQIIVVKLC